MRSVRCNINGEEVLLVYSSEIKQKYVEFRGRLYTEPPFDFKYLILNTGEVTFVEPRKLDDIICDRITQIILNDQSNTPE